MRAVGFARPLLTEMELLPNAAPGGAPAPAVAAALARLYDAYAAGIYHYIYRRVGNREDAEDLTTQVFMKALPGLDPTQPQAGQRAWLYQIARTTLLDHWRLYYKGPAASLEARYEAYGYEEMAAHPALAAPAPDSAPGDPAARQVAALLDQLPANYRQVLTLRFLHGYSLKETAAAMQISEGNVKVLQHRAIQRAIRLRTPIPS